MICTAWYGNGCRTSTACYSRATRAKTSKETMLFFVAGVRSMLPTLLTMELLCGMPWEVASKRTIRCWIWGLDVLYKLRNTNNEIRNTNDEGRGTKYEIRMTRDEGRGTKYEWRGTKYEIRMTRNEIRDNPRTPEPSKGDKPQKRLLFVLTGINDELWMTRYKFTKL